MLCCVVLCCVVLCCVVLCCVMLCVLAARRRPRLRWDNASEEHVAEYVDGEGRKHKLFYPTLLSLQRRIELAQEAGAGLSIWELGQGLESWMDLF